MSDIIISYKINVNERIKLGYRRITDNTFTYISSPLYQNQSPYTISGVAQGSYVVQLTTLNDCGKPCGVAKEYIAVAHPLTTTTSTTTTTTSTSTTSTTTTTTTLPPPPIKVKIYWGAFESDPGDVSDVTLTKFITIDHGDDYIIPTTETTGLLYYIVRELNAEPVKRRYSNTPLNSGKIPDQVWLDPIEDSYYRYYKSNGLVSFNEGGDTKFLQ